MRKYLEPKLLALVAALGLVAQSEWMLALAVGWPVWVAWLAPVALDAYVVHAVRTRRDLGPSVIVSAVSVLASHAVYAAPAAWQGDHLKWFWAATCSVVPLLVAWRVHHLHQPDSEPTQAILAPPAPATVQVPGLKLGTTGPQSKSTPRPSNGKAQATDDDLEQVVKPLVRAGKGRPTIQRALKDAGLACSTDKLVEYMASLRGEAVLTP